MKNRKEELLKEIKKLKNELNKNNKIIKEKNDKIDELTKNFNEFREEQNKKFDRQVKLLEEEQRLSREHLVKIDKQTSMICNQTNTINELNNKIDNQSRLLVKVTEKLDKLVDNILKLDKHLTSNSVCKYKIILYTTEDITNKQPRDILEVNSFVGLVENSPNLTNVNVLLNKEVSCSLDSFKTVLTKLNSYVEGVKYRKIYIEKWNLERFIDNFKAELGNINNPIEELKNEVKNLSGKVTEVNNRLNNIEQFIMNKYNLSLEDYRDIVEGMYTITYKKRVRVVKINEELGKIYVNNSEIYYIEPGEI